MLIVLRALVRTVGEILCVEFFFFSTTDLDPDIISRFFLIEYVFFGPSIDGTLLRATGAHYYYYYHRRRLRLSFRPTRYRTRDRSCL